MNKHRFSFILFSLTLPISLAAVVIFLLIGSPVQAASVVVDPVVNTLADEQNGDCATTCTLRDAIAVADSGSVVTFDISGTIVLSPSLGPLTISQDLTISGTQPITISGDANGNNIADDVQLVEILGLADVTVVFDTLNFIYGYATVQGGAIKMLGANDHVTVRNSLFWRNKAEAAGAISSGSGQLTVFNCSFMENVSDFEGGAIASGIESSGSVISIDQSTFMANDANAGGALYVGVFGEATAVISNSTIASNTAAFGAGIYNSNNGMVSIDASVIHHNDANGGSGLYNEGVAVVNNSTFSNNLYGNEVDGAAAIRAGGTTTVTYVTIADNITFGAGYALYVPAGGVLHLYNSIVANTIQSLDCQNDGTIANNQNNLIETGNCNGAVTADPNLGSLSDNGGATWTHALISPSIAIDYIAPSLTALDATAVTGCVSGTNVDQRGAVRADGPGRGNNGCDLGAYEFSQQTPTAVTLHTIRTQSHLPLALIGGLFLTLLLLGGAFAVRRR